MQGVTIDPVYKPGQTVTMGNIISKGPVDFRPVEPGYDRVTVGQIKGSRVNFHPTVEHHSTLSV